MNKILIVDDDLEFLETMVIVLSDHNFEVKTTKSKDDIYKAILNFNPQVILLDIHLNGADGRDICMGLKYHYRTKDIPIILCSGDTNIQDNYPKNIVEEFVQKPFNYISLIVRLEEYCKKPPSYPMVA